MTSTAAPRQVPCPTCQRPAPFVPENRWRPFCSQRCRSADLGAWASERFRIAASPEPTDDGESAPGPSPAT